MRVAASVATHDGNTGQAAELFGWLASGAGPGGDATVGAAGVIVFVAAGQAAEAREVADSHGRGTAHLDRPRDPQPGRGPAADTGPALRGRGGPAGSGPRRRDARVRGNAGQRRRRSSP